MPIKIDWEKVWGRTIEKTTDEFVTYHPKLGEFVRFSHRHFIAKEVDRQIAEQEKGG